VMYPRQPPLDTILGCVRGEQTQRPAQLHAGA